MKSPGPPFKSKMRLRDLLSEAAIGALSRPGRALLTSLGTMLGIGALVATVGLASTARAEVERSFNLLSVTAVTVERRSDSIIDEQSALLPWNADDQLRRLYGVVDVGSLTVVSVGEASIRSLQVADPVQVGGVLGVEVVALSPDAFNAIAATLSTGRFFDAGHDARHDRVAVLGRGAADRLGITRVDQRQAVFVGERSFTIIGVLGNVDRDASLLNAVIVPESTAREIWELLEPGRIEILTLPGAAATIAEQAALALMPNDPGQLRVSIPPEPRILREKVAADLASLSVALGVMVLLTGALGIAHTTLASVLERTHEIGIRRAVGARRKHIALQFVLESGLIGLFGGVTGAALGLATTVVVSAQRGWTPAMDLWVVTAGPIVGGIVGLASGSLPSLRAARMQPVDALRVG
ncbi:MAG: ABC transporter permease [Acidimicrobiia bacterium]|nr:MAG: ABC transporter permease [Acidimicrobiia bacterium]